MPSKEQRLTDIRNRLAAAGNEYEAAKSSVANTRAALDPLIAEALKAGMAPGDVQRLSRLSHETVRTIARINGVGPAPRGGARS